ncbi:EAL domain-containing protein [Enterobacter hormaechei]|uniref:EAL domain-containing protein n=1 Tax=Enterobacter hormaechei TaxID=158836 RepID=UPI0032D9FD1E
MAEMVTEISERLGLEVVAEGVETTGQRDWMIQHGVQWHQGYLFSRPFDAAAFVR